MMVGLRKVATFLRFITQYAELHTNELDWKARCPLLTTKQLAFCKKSNYLKLRTTNAILTLNTQAVEVVDY